MKKILAPSLLSANFYDLKSDLEILKLNKIDYLHLDVMDGKFVPNISFGLPVIKAIKKHTDNDFVFDTHLMIEEPEKYIKEFKNVGSNVLTVHIEACRNVKDVIDKIKSEKMEAGIAIDLNTDIKTVEKILDIVDIVLVMSVKAGFGGQKFTDFALDKIKYLNEKKMENGYNYRIEIDGGVNIDNLKKIKDAGIDIIVAGSAIFDGDVNINIKKFNNILEEFYE